VGEAGALSQKEGSVSNQSAPRSVLPVVPQRQHKSYKQAKLTSLLAIPVLLPRPDIGGGKPQGGPAAVKPVQPRTDNSTQHGADVNDQTEQQQRQQENNSVVKCIATTSVDPAVSAALKDAVSKLGGAHVYVEGQADIHITHLVIGAERRTIKCLLAIAAGAHLVGAGGWLRCLLEWLICLQPRSLREIITSCVVCCTGLSLMGHKLPSCWQVAA
jgi:hypothetical protein